MIIKSIIVQFMCYFSHTYFLKQRLGYVCGADFQQGATRDLLKTECNSIMLLYKKNSWSSFVSGDVCMFQTAKNCLKQCFSTFLILWPLNIALWWTTIKLLSLILHNYIFAFVMNHDVNIFGNRGFPKES